MEEIKTCELVNELSKREGVQEIIVEPYENIEIITETKRQALGIAQGPARILVIWD